MTLLLFLDQTILESLRANKLAVLFDNSGMQPSLGRDFVTGTFEVQVERERIVKINTAREALEVLFMVFWVFNIQYQKGTEKFFREMEKSLI